LIVQMLNAVIFLIAVNKKNFHRMVKDLSFLNVIY
jgi:hypothetical protein